MAMKGLILLLTCFFCGPAMAGVLPADRQSAVIFAYHRIADDASPSSSLRVEQFDSQLKELKDGKYNVISLGDALSAFERGVDLPDKTVVLTFDGGHVSFLTHALPKLEAYAFPYTLFISPGMTQQVLEWDDLRRLQKSRLATIGLHPQTYARLTDAGDIKRQVNSAISEYRQELGAQPEFFAYPFGEYSRAYRDIVEIAGFKGAVGQHSGVAHAGADIFTLPRFTLTERYGDADRFLMAASALPLPVSDISPVDPALKDGETLIGFTVAPELSSQLKDLSCFISDQGQPAIELVGGGRVELRPAALIEADRTRVNCTLPGGVDGENDNAPRWRWMGMLLTLPVKETLPDTGDALEP